MASNERPQDRPGRRLTKKRKEPRRVSLDIPERFRDGDDAQEDVTAPKRKDAMSMNQSLFSMIARAGQQSQSDLHAMQDIDSGDSDDGRKPTDGPYHGLDGAARLSRISTSKDFHNSSDGTGDGRRSMDKHRRALSEHKLLRPFPKLHGSGRRESHTEPRRSDAMSSSQLLARPPESEPIRHSQGDHSSKGQAQTPTDELRAENRGAGDKTSRSAGTAGVAKGTAPATLAKRLHQIFEFESLEEVISGRPNLHSPSRTLT